MSRNEVIQAYMNGRIGRREFMRRMVATGASLVAAAALADDLAAAPAQTSSRRSSALQDDVYDDVYGGDDVYEEEDPVTSLPDTGTGPVSSGSGLLKPFALAASAAAAAIGFRLRRSNQAEPETE